MEVQLPESEHARVGLKVAILPALLVLPGDIRNLNRGMDQRFVFLQTVEKSMSL